MHKVKLLVAGVLLSCFSSNVFSALSYDIQGAKVISVETLWRSGDAFFRIVLDMSTAGIDMSSDVATCAPTMNAWVVTMSGAGAHLESAAFSVALAAQTLGATVDVMIDTSVSCDTSNNYPNLPAPGSPLAVSGGPVPSGLGMRVGGIKVTQD